MKWRDTERLLNTLIVPAWRGRPINTIDRATAHELLDDIAMKQGIGPAREVRKHVTKLFNWAVDRGLLAASPVAGMRRPELGDRSGASIFPRPASGATRTSRSNLHRSSAAPLRVHEPAAGELSGLAR